MRHVSVRTRGGDFFLCADKIFRVRITSFLCADKIFRVRVTFFLCSDRIFRERITSFLCADKICAFVHPTLVE